MIGCQKSEKWSWGWLLMKGLCAGGYKEQGVGKVVFGVAFDEGFVCREIQRTGCWESGLNSFCPRYGYIFVPVIMAVADQVPYISVHS